MAEDISIPILNEIYVPDGPPLQSLLPTSVWTEEEEEGSCVGRDGEVDQEKVLRILKKREENPATEPEIRKVMLDHSIAAWGIGESFAKNAKILCSSEGSYVIDIDGNRYLDLNANSMNANLGYTPPPEVLEAITYSVKNLYHNVPTSSTTRNRADLCLLLNSLMPRDLSHFFFTLSGAESNEAAIRMARLYTGRTKVISSLRSYHGASTLCLSITGDLRRNFTEPFQAPDCVHVASCHPYYYQWGKTEEEMTENYVNYLREIVLGEGSHTVAAIILEPVVGTNGLLIPPKGLLQGIRALCDEYDIVMILDEVMAAWLRTGKWFAFMHTDPLIIPDMVTMAKGITCGFVPFGAVAVRSKIGKYFQKNPCGVGATYQSHAVGIACASAVIKYYLSQNIQDHVRRMGALLVKRLSELKEKHRSVRFIRLIGLFCFVGFRKNSNGEPFAHHMAAPMGAVKEFQKVLMEQGVSAFVKGSGFFINPPLNITEEDLMFGVNAIDKALEVCDAVFDKE